MSLKLSYLFLFTLKNMAARLVNVVHITFLLDNTHLEF